jgi:predicted permease
MAGAAAILSSIWSVQAIRNSLSQDYTKWIAGWQNMHLDPATVIFAVSATIVMAVLLGIVTGVSAARAPFQEGLKESGRAGGGFRESRVRSVLVVVQIAMAVALLAGSGLMITGFHRLQGFFATLQPESLLRFTVSLPESRYAQAANVNSFYQRLLTNVRALPGVRSAGMITNPPASNVDSPRAQFTIEGRAVPRPADMPSADRQYVSSETLTTLNVPLVQGRMIAEQDGPEAQRVAVISQSLARLYWPDQSALNQRIRFSPTEAPVTIVGVVGELRINWADRTIRPTIYLPYSQAVQRRFTFLVRSEGAPLNLAPHVRQLVWNQDAALALNSVGPFTKEVEDTLAPIRVLGMLVMAFGLVSLCLAAIGLYGAIAYSVLQRQHEFGVRMALGAARTDVLNLVLGNVLKLAAAGLAAGLILAFVLMRVTTSLVYGAVAFNAAVFSLVTTAILVVALISGLIPARVASRVDPAVALRAE